MSEKSNQDNQKLFLEAGQLLEEAKHALRTQARNSLSYSNSKSSNGAGKPIINNKGNVRILKPK